MHCQPVQKLTDSILELQANLSSCLDWNALELSLRNVLHEFIEQILLPSLQEILDDRIGFLAALKQLAASKGMRFNGFRKTSVRIFTGSTLSISSPYFVKTKSKRKHKKDQHGTGCHLGLEVLGFIERTSANLASNVIQLAILCPSFNIARNVLHEQGIVLDIKTVQRLCRKFGQGAMKP